MSKATSNQIKQIHNQLWCDKYHPTNYTELLTDERVNREILTWMKSWDEIVFNKKFNPPKIPVQTNEFTSNDPFGGIQKNNNKSFPYKNNKNPTSPNQTNKPSQYQYQFPKTPYEIEYLQSKNKIILISGPPGIGKTTLAVIIAKQCGYDPLIINASDERTPDKLIMRIYDTTLMQNLHKTKKPTCLILDEIDGIVGDYSGKNSIKSIIDFIKNGKVSKGVTGKAKKQLLDLHTVVRGIFSKDNHGFKERREDNHGNNDNDDNSEDDQDNDDNDKENKSDDEGNNDKKGKKTKKSAKNNGIKRPIICICNDVYAKAIALLRKESLVYNIKKADEKKILDRLVEICKKERLDITRSSLHNLCDKTKFDIRATLNSLQFIAYNKINLNLLTSLSSVSFSAIGLKDMNENLFSIWNKIFLPNAEKQMSYKQMLSLFYSSGEFFKVIEGLYVNYLKIPNKETKEDILKRAELTDLFSYEDTLSKKVIQSQAFELNNYMCLSGLYMNNTYSAMKYEKNIIEYPSLFYDIRKESKINKRILEMIRENIEQTRHLSSLSTKAIVLDILPYIFQLIQPEIRIINPELMNQKELKQIKISSALMGLCGLNFSEQNIEDNDTMNEIKINYEPNIKRVLSFPNVQLNTRLTPNQKFILKIEYEKMKSMHIQRYSEIIHSEDIVKKDFKQMEKNKADVNSIMNTLTLGKKRKSNQLNAPEYKFVYKFHEGVTNCVKRPLNIHYFFPKNE